MSENIDTITSETQTNITQAFTRGTVVNPGRMVLLQPDTNEQPDECWISLGISGEIHTTHVDMTQRTDEQLDDTELIARLVQTVRALAGQNVRVQEDARELRKSIGEMREYAIQAHRNGSFCREGLNEALRKFDLEEYAPRYSVPVTVRATFEVDAENEEAAERRVRYLVDGVLWSGQSNEDHAEVEMSEIEVDQAEPA